MRGARRRHFNLPWLPGGTMTVPRGPADCRAREVLERIGDKWSLLVIGLLGEGPLRFAELRRSVDGISQRMVTVTLRGLERDGPGTPAPPRPGGPSCSGRRLTSPPADSKPGPAETTPPRPCPLPARGRSPSPPQR